MSVYNDVAFLVEAVESILNQTCPLFEFIVIDDGSTDSTWRVLEAFRDPRIVLLRNSQNIGLTKSLNRGLTIARGEYVARQDADEVSLPNRLEVQVAHLDSHPEIALLGSSHWSVDEHGRRHEFLVTPDSLHLQYTLLFRTPFAHGTVMFRHEIVEKLGFYDEQRFVAQDYDLWSRIAHHHQIGAVHLPLVIQQLNATSISTLRSEEQHAHALDISVRNIRTCLRETDIEISLAQQLHYLANGCWSAVDPNRSLEIVTALLLIERNLVACHTHVSTNNPKSLLALHRCVEDLAIGLIGFLGESGYLRAAGHLIVRLMRGNRTLLIKPNFCRALARCALGSSFSARVRSAWHRLNRVGIRYD